MKAPFLKLILGAAALAALTTGCSTIKNTTAGAVDLAGAITGHGPSTTVRGGLSEVGDFDGCKPRIFPTKEPSIFGGPDNYKAYLSAKALMARTEGDPRLSGMFPKKDSVTALLRGKYTIDNAKKTGLLTPSWRLPWTPPAYTGQTEIRIKHEGDGMTYVQVLEKGNDVEFLLAGRYDAAERFKQQVFYTSYYMVNTKGVMYGETWAPEFIGGLRPITLFLGKTTPGISDDGLTDQIRGIIARRDRMNIQYVTAAYNGGGLCDVEPNSTFCRMTVDDQLIIGNAISIDFEKGKPTLAGLEPSIIDAINTKPGAEGKPAKKELSW